MIGIFDYGVGNLLNLKNAIDHLGLENCIVQNSDQLESCMENQDSVSMVQKFLSKSKPAC